MLSLLASLRLPPLFRRSQDESSTEPQDRLASPPGSFGSSGNETEETEGTTRFEEVRRLQGEIEELNRWLERQEADVVRLKVKEEELTKDCKSRGDRIAELEHEIGQMHGFYREDARRQTQHIQAMKERLKQTEELLATRSAELSGAQAFLSTTDHLSEAEVLSIVRDLNENIYQVAVNLTEEWEKLEPSQASRMDIDPASPPRIPTLVQRVLSWDPTGLTFLLQSCLCSQVEKMTSSWGHHQELIILESIYQRLSATGESRIICPAASSSHLVEGQAISARWRSLTHSYLSQPLPDSALLVVQLANVLYETGSFSSAQESLELVKAVALEGIETIIRLALHLESVFMVDVTSSDMFLLSETPGTRFEDARMDDEFGSNCASAPGKCDMIVGTTEVGVGKSVFGRVGESRRTEILLKTNVVLEKDVVDS